MLQRCLEVDGSGFLDGRVRVGQRDGFMGGTVGSGPLLHGKRVHGDEDRDFRKFMDMVMDLPREVWRFFGLVLGLKLTSQEKRDLVAFMLAL